MTFLGLFQLQTGGHGHETAWPVGCRVSVPANCQGSGTSILSATLATVPVSSFSGSDILSATPKNIRTPTTASGPGLGYTATRAGVLRYEMKTSHVFTRSCSKGFMLQRLHCPHTVTPPCSLHATVPDALA